MVVLAEEGEGYSPPGAGDFKLPAVFDLGGLEITKPYLMALLATAVLVTFLYFASRRSAIVPGRLQFAGEGIYGFVRRDLGRDILGSENFLKFLPLIFSLFIFVALNNVFGIVPLIQFPTMSLTGSIVTLIVAEPHSPSMSRVSNTKLSLPLRLAVGT